VSERDYYWITGTPLITLTKYKRLDDCKLFTLQYLIIYSLWTIFIDRFYTWDCIKLVSGYCTARCIGYGVSENGLEAILENIRFNCKYRLIIRIASKVRNAKYCIDAFICVFMCVYIYIFFLTRSAPRAPPVATV
jgi:hypothetical protein